jgi:hypothetical protein
MGLSTESVRLDIYFLKKFLEELPHAKEEPDIAGYYHT